MAMEKLTAQAVRNAKKPGLYGDGGGLWLQVTEGKAPGQINKSWVFRFMLDGRARKMGLGSLNTFTLAEARERARAQRQLLADRIDPIERKMAESDRQAREAKERLPFKEAAEKFLAVHRDQWSNAKHQAQWESTLRKYTNPIAARPVAAIDGALITDCIAMLLRDGKRETADRVQQRINRILQWVKDGMPAPRGRKERDHQPALPYTRIGEFMADLRTRSGEGARALELLILTASRPGEVAGARRDEFDLTGKVWTIPSSRMKARREHRVALSDTAVALVQKLMADAPGDLLFGRETKSGVISDATMNATIKRMNEAAEKDGRAPYVDPKEDGRRVVAHGFRSTFRDWAGETTSYAREIAEAALAHINSNKVEAAYQRGDLFEKRARLMQAWADFVDTPPTAEKRDNVVAIGAR